MKFVAQLEVLAAWTHSIHEFCITSMAMLLSRERNVPRQERDGCWLYGAQNEGFHVQRIGRCINGREKQDCFGRKARGRPISWLESMPRRRSLFKLEAYIPYHTSTYIVARIDAEEIKLARRG